MLLSSLLRLLVLTDSPCQRKIDCWGDWVWKSVFTVDKAFKISFHKCEDSFRFWQEEGWTESIIFVVFVFPHVWNISKKISILDEFHGLVPLLSKYKLSDELWAIVCQSPKISQSHVFSCFFLHMRNCFSFAFCFYILLEVIINIKTS